MATTVGQHQVSTITDPADGSSMVAATMRTATNAVRTGANDHDNDSGLHLQSSVAGSRPAAGTAGRKWIDTDTLLLKYDNGVSWDDLNYLKLSGGTLTAGLTVSAGGVTVTGNSTITGTLGGLTGLTVASGGITVTGDSTITGTLGGVTTLTCDAISGLTALSVSGNISATGQVYSAGVTVQSVAGVTVNWNNGNFQALNWNSNGATITFSNPQEGAVYYLRLVVGGGTGYNLTWPAAVDWTGSALTSAPVSATTYLIRLLYDGTTYWADYTTNT